MAIPDDNLKKAKKHHTWLILFFLIFTTSSIVLVAGSSNEVISIDSLYLNPNNTAHVTLSIENAIDLQSIYFEVAYDPSLLSISSMDASSVFSNSSLDHNIDNSAGLATAELSDINITGINKMELVDIQLFSIKSGISELELQNISLENTTLQYSPDNISNGSVVINFLPDLSPLEDMFLLPGENLQFSLNATDMDDNILTYDAFGLPNGSHFDVSSGIFSWTPQNSDAGVHTVGFSVSDNMYEDFETVNITVGQVLANTAPLLDTIGNKSIYEGESLIIKLNGSDINDDPLMYSTNAMFGTLNGSEFTWDSDYSDSGIYSVEFSVNDGELNDSEIVIITVINVNIAPVLSPITTQLIDEMDTLNLELNAYDFDGDLLYFTKDATFGELNGNIFTWVPGNNDSGFHNVVFTVSDGYLADNQTVTIAVGDTNVPPVLDAIGNLEIYENQSISIILNASDIDGDILTYSISGLPQGATFDSSLGKFAWTPSYEQAGNYTLVCEVNDGVYNDVELVTISVKNVNRVPSIYEIGDMSINEGDELRFVVSGYDSDIGDLLTYSVTNLPSDSSFNELTHEFIWIPDYNAAGIYSVTFTVSDGSLSNSETIDIIVNDVDQAPVLNSIGNKNIAEGSILHFTILAIDSDDDSVIYSSPSLPDDSILDSSTGEFLWSTDYSDAGTYTVEFIATSNGLTDSELVTITVGGVDQSPILDPIGDKLVNEDDVLSFIVSATDPDDNQVIYSSPSLPSGSTLDPHTGKFSWTPDYDASGVYNVEFIVTANGLMDSETIMITVTDVNRAPVLSEIEDMSVNEGSELLFTIDASDPDGNDIIYSVAGLPPGSSFNELTHEFSWVPGYEDSGNYVLTFSVSDGSILLSETINIVVYDINRAPMLDVIGSRSADENVPLTFTLNAMDLDGDVLEYSADALPEGSELDSTTGIFTWDPSYEDSGIYSIRFMVSDGFDDDSETVSITINDVNRPPSMSVPSQITISENFTLTLNLNTSDPDADPLEYSTDAEFGSLNENIFTWTPNFEDAGTYSVLFSVDDGEYKITSISSITVTQSNGAPVLNSIPDHLVNELESLTIDLTASDIDGDDLVYSKDVTFGTLVDNTFTWTPQTNQNGFHYIVFTVSDGSLTDSKTAKIAVGNTNIPPEINPIGTQQVNENERLSFKVNASDPDGDALTYSAVNLPDGAILNSTTGLFEWVPSYDQSGVYVVEFRVSDRIYTDIETISIEVKHVNRAPVFNSNVNYSLNETETLRIDLNAFDPDGDSLTFSANCSYGSVIGNVFTWTPDCFEGGNYNIEFTVADDYLTDSSVISVVVYEKNVAPEILYVGPQYVNENETLNFSIQAFDVDGDALIYSVTGLPKGASFNNLTGMFSWKPTYNQAGTYSVEFKVNDGQFDTLKAVSINVDDVDLSTVAVFKDVSSTGGGSSGSSGGIAAEDYENIDYRDFSQKYVASGIDISFDFPNEQNDLEYIRFRSLMAAGQVKTVIDILNDQSTLVKNSPPGNVYKNINIWVGDAKFNSGKYYSSAVIGFKVEKQWLLDNGISISSVKMYRYSNGGWTELNTFKTGSDSDYYYFRSRTPGFSSFAIVGLEPSAPKVNTQEQLSIDESESMLFVYDSASSGNTGVVNSYVSSQHQPFSSSIFTMIIFGIIVIGLALGYNSRNDSQVLRSYLNIINGSLIWVKNMISILKRETSSEALQNDQKMLMESWERIKSADYKRILRDQLEEIKNRQ